MSKSFDNMASGDKLLVVIGCAICLVLAIGFCVRGYESTTPCARAPEHGCVCAGGTK